MSSQILCALYNPAPYAHSSRVGYSIRRHTKGGCARPVSAARKPIVVPKRRRYNQQSFSSCAGMHTQNFPSPQNAKLPIATTLNGTDRGYSPSLFGGASSSCALVALEPLPLSWSRLEMWCDRRRIAPARNHGASHLVTIGIEGPLQEEGTTCALLLVRWKKSRQVQHMRVPLNVRAWPQLMR